MNMQRVLFICGNYDPYPSANGVCVLRLQEALHEKGILSDVVCASEKGGMTKSKYGFIYHLQLPVIRNGFLRKSIRFFIWPLKDPRMVNTYREMIQQAKREHEYSLLIGVLRPIEGLLACMDLGDFVIYECDSITNNGENEFGLKHLLRRRVDNIEKQLYDKAKWIFHMACHSAYYSQNRYDKWREKSEIVDIPQLVDEGITDSSGNHYNVIQILYSGTLSKDTRSPEYAISVILELSERMDKQIETNFYSKGNCEAMLEKAESVSSGIIKRRGYVSLQQLDEAVGDTDFLLSIGNRLTGIVTSLPSKVISYMAYGKPIIHIDGGENDIAKEYLEKYPLTVIINPHSNQMDNINIVHEFIKKNLGKRVSFQDIKKSFPLNTPQYTVERIMKLL